MLPITATFNPATGLLFVTGDNFGTRIDISRDVAGTIFVNGGAVAIQGGIPTVANTSEISILDGNGSTVIDLDEAHGALPSVHLVGLGGNDILVGGSGNDLIEGGAGVDQLVGGAGDDVLVGGPDPDTLAGGPGIDTASYLNSAVGVSVDLVAGANFGDARGDTLSDIENLTGSAFNDQLFGDEGDNVLTGGAGADELQGRGGVDTASYANSAAGVTVSLLAGTGSTGDATGDTLIDIENLTGSSFADTLIGDAGNNVLTGGAGADILIGGAGDDIFNWSPGDGNDAIEGGTGVDTLFIRGGNDTEAFTISAAGGRVKFDQTFPVASHLDIGSTENIVIDLGDGGNTLNVGNGLAALTNLTINGGTNSDEIHGGDGVDVINGGDGGDIVTGGGGNDLISLGAGDDAFSWKAGEGNDTVDGGSGSDVAGFFGSNASEHVDISAHGSHVHFSRDVDNVTVDLNQIERIQFFSMGGADTIAVNDLSGTGVQGVELGLQGQGNVDNQPDSVFVAGTSGSDAIVVESSLQGVVVRGLPWQVSISDVKTVDSLIIHAGDGNDTINAPAVAATSMALTLDGGAGNDTIIGGAGNDKLIGGDGDDTLIGGPGADALIGGAGSDTASYSTSAAGVTVNLATGAASGGDAQGDTLSGIENLTGSAFADTLIGNAGNNVLNGGAGDDLLTGGAGDDTLIGGPGADALVGGAGSDTASYATSAAGVGVDLEDGSTAGGAVGDAFSGIENLTGSAFADNLLGDAGDNVLTGLDGADALKGRAGNDTLDGGAGTDTAVYSGTHTQYHIDQLANGDLQVTDLRPGSPDGTDTVRNVEKFAFFDVTLAAGALAVNHAPAINSDGGGDNAAVSLLENAAAVTTVTVTDIDPGTSLAYSIVGGADAAHFHIDASTGALSFVTAPDFEGATDSNHDNSYIVQVRAFDGSLSDDQTITVNITDVFEQPVNLVGGPGPDTLIGGAGNDALDGQGSNDTLIGATGHDLYYVQDAGDVIVENPNEGFDSVIAYVTYTLPANVEAIYTLDGGGATGNGLDNLLDAAYATTAQTLDGQGGNDILYGTVTGDDLLIGGAGSDALYGLGGNDTMQGGAGDDAYFVDQAGDVVQENPGEGLDTIYASVNYTLPANVEVIEPYGNATGATGNGDDNVLIGVNGANNGTAGFTLDGAGGNDTIYGSNFDDTMIGGAGNDFMWGFLGNDTMQGGTGDDVYIVEQAGDVAQENPGEGNDTVYASVNFTLPANVENLFVYGGAKSGSGNSADNLIVNEFITSGVTLTGGGGNDTFVFIPGTANGTTITDFAGNGAGAGDVLEFAAYGAGATFTGIDATHWQVNYGAGLSLHDVITFSNAPAIDPSDVLFV